MEVTIESYTVDYFIEKFEKIPPEKWTTGQYVSDNDRECCCALGHCGIRNINGLHVASHSPEAMALTKLFNNSLVHCINDSAIEYGNTPKERILNKLKEIKSSTNDN